MTAGDEGFVKVVQSSVWSRTDETDPKERLSPLVPLIQEFHARKLGISCNREEFDLQNQIRVSKVEYTNLISQSTFTSTLTGNRLSIQRQGSWRPQPS